MDNLVLMVICLNAVLVPLYVVIGIMRIRENRKFKIEYLRYIEHLYILLDVLAVDSSAHIRHTFNTLRQKNFLDTDYDINKALREGIIAEYTTYRPLIVESVENIINPEEKDEKKKMLIDMDNMVTLLSSITENSLPEYENQIMREVTVGLRKLKNF